MTDNEKGKEEVRVITEDDIEAVVQILRVKNGPPMLNYPTGDLALTCDMLSEALQILANLIRRERPEEERRIIPAKVLPVKFPLK